MSIVTPPAGLTLSEIGDATDRLRDSGVTVGTFYGGFLSTAKELALGLRRIGRKASHKISTFEHSLYLSFLSFANSKISPLKMPAALCSISWALER